MLPLRDTIPSRTLPFVTIGILALNLLAFLVELGHGAQFGRFLADHGLVPVRYFWLAEQQPHDLLARFGPVLGSMFLHGSWLHLLGNMVFLWIFADNVEDRLGHGRFLFFYLAVGVVAAMMQVYLFPGGQFPIIGTSGAITGLLGAYLLLFPRSRVLTAVPVPFYIHVVEVPAVFFLGLWVLLQFLAGSLEHGRAVGEAAGGGSWWALLGAFGAGMLLGPLMRRRHPRKRKTYPTREIFHPW